MSQAKEILAASSIYYIQRPFASKHLIIKLIWIIFLIVLFLGINYYVLLNILDYLDYNTVTSIYEIDENESQFPTISICSENDKNFEINVLSLSFNFKSLQNEWQNHLQTYNDAYFGKCYRFNTGLNWKNQPIPIKYSKKSSYKDGFLFLIQKFLIL